MLAVMVISAFIAGMIGQYNDGPWGQLPPWLGAASYFTFLGSVLAVVLLSVYLGVANLRYRQRQRQSLT